MQLCECHDKLIIIVDYHSLLYCKIWVTCQGKMLLSPIELYYCSIASQVVVVSEPKQSVPVVLDVQSLNLEVPLL